MKAIVVGRHGLLQAQSRLLERAGIEVVEVVSQIPTTQIEIQRFVSELREKGIEAIVVQALPMHLLMWLHQEARKHNMSVFTFRMKTVATTTSKEEAEKLVNEKPHARTTLPSSEGSFRVVEVESLEKVREIRLETETVVKVEE